MHGFYRVASAVNKTIIANPQQNALEILSLLEEAFDQDVSVIVFPELTLTSYSSSDLFFNQLLLSQQNEALNFLLKKSTHISTIAILGIVLLHNNRLYNCSIILQNGNILGIVPKSYLPNKKNFMRNDTLFQEKILKIQKPFF